MRMDMNESMSDVVREQCAVGLVKADGGDWAGRGIEVTSTYNDGGPDALSGDSFMLLFDMPSYDRNWKVHVHVDCVGIRRVQSGIRYGSHDHDRRLDSLRFDLDELMRFELAVRRVVTIVTDRLRGQAVPA